MEETNATKHSVDLTVPLAEIDVETARVVAGIQKKVKLPGFRPGKAPLSIIQSRFESEIRQDVLEAVIPKAFNAHAEKENLRVVGSPNVTDVHFHKGEPLKFKIEFELFPEFDLGEYRGLTVTYNEPEISDADVDARIEMLRDQKADYSNVDPRPLEKGDHAVISLKSVAGLEEPMEQDEMVLEVGKEDSLPEFNEHLTGMTPGEDKEFDVAYPEQYGNERLAGRTVRFRVALKGIRKKELPELNDEFAADVGDFKSIEELREQARRDLFQEREMVAVQEARGKLLDSLIDAHNFPVPDSMIDRQVDAVLEGRLREMMSRGIDPRQLNVDWREVKKSQRPQAARDVKANLLLDKIAEREAIETLTDEVDREVIRIAKQMREPVAAVRKRLEEDGAVRRIASRIRTDKVLNFLFENARKVAGEAS